MGAYVSPTASDGNDKLSNICKDVRYRTRMARWGLKRTNCAVGPNEQRKREGDQETDNSDAIQSVGTTITNIPSEGDAGVK